MKIARHCLHLFIATSSCLAAAAGGEETAPASPRCFTIKIVDEDSGRGVPLVELTTVSDVRFVTDSAGVAAIYEPGLMDESVFFHVQSHGYEFPPDGFGIRGRRATLTPGGSVRWKIKRLNIAQRLYRVTGAGIYRDSVLGGGETPIDEPLLNAKVTGSDSVQCALFRGRVHWFWGDTNRPGYPLGNFHVPGATSLLAADGGLPIERGINLTYFAGEEGFAKETCRMPGAGPTWISGLCVIEDEGRQRMFAVYVKVRGQLDVYERGLVEFDPERQEFEKVATWELDAPIAPNGHTFVRQENGRPYVHFCDPFPDVRVPATAEALADISRYEAFTCLQKGSSAESPRVERDDKGVLVYRWRQGARPARSKLADRLVKAGAVEREELRFRLRDVETGRPVRAQGGSCAYNEYRRRWILIAVEQGGTSFLGEVWYAEAEQPTGPWRSARKIVTHQKYSFYNPKHHPMFDADGGRVIYFEGTYSTFLSGNEDATPRYNYNQLLYRLDLSDERLHMPREKEE